MAVLGKLGLDLQPAVNAVEAGILAVSGARSTGRLKVFATLPRWVNEYRIYHRDEKRRIVKKEDHLWTRPGTGG